MRKNTSKVLEIISIIVFLTVTAIICTLFVSVCKDVSEASKLPENEMDWSGLGFALSLVISVIICIAYIVSTVLSIISLFVGKGVITKLHKIINVLLALSPIIMGAINIGAYLILKSIYF
jgi:hypothetical protein